MMRRDYQQIALTATTATTLGTMETERNSARHSDKKLRTALSSDNSPIRISRAGVATAMCSSAEASVSREAGGQTALSSALGTRVGSLLGPLDKHEVINEESFQKPGSTPVVDIKQRKRKLFKSDSEVERE